MSLPTLSQASAVAQFVHRIRAWNAVDAMQKINPLFMDDKFAKRRQNILDYACSEAAAAWKCIRA